MLTIRTASHEDVALLWELGTITFRAAFEKDNTPEDMDAYLADNLSEEKLTGELSDPLSTFLLVEISGKPIGYAKLHRGAADDCVTGANPIELVRLYVLPESIGQGVGAGLMNACLSQARAEGFETLWLGVWEHNQRAIDFYRKWEFVEVGSHVFQLGSDAQTDLILQKTLR